MMKPSSSMIKPGSSGGTNNNGSMSSNQARKDSPVPGGPLIKPNKPRPTPSPSQQQQSSQQQANKSATSGSDLDAATALLMNTQPSQMHISSDLANNLANFAVADPANASSLLNSLPLLLALQAHNQAALNQLNASQSESLPQTR